MSLIVAPAPASLLKWDPTTKQVIEADTTYLMDLDAEEALDVTSGRMIGSGEAFADTTTRPPWIGGTATARVPGKYRDGMQTLTDGAFLAVPAGGLWTPDQGTIEFFVNSSVDWSAISNQTAFQMQSYFGQLIKFPMNTGAAGILYQQNQTAAGQISQQAFSSAQSFTAGTWVSLAATLAANTMTLYINGVSAASVSGCTAPAFWGDAWAPARTGGGLSIGGSTQLTISDLRISRLARVPGAVPSWA